MSGVDWKEAERKALAGVVRSLGKMAAMPSNVVTRREAARRLCVSTKRLSLMIRLDLITTVRVGRRELVILVSP